MNSKLAIALLLPPAIAAGCASTSRSPAVDAAAAGAAASAADGLVQAIAFDGMTPAYADACAFLVVAGACVHAPPTADFSRASVEPKLDGEPAGLRATIAWTPVGPGERRMTIFAGVREGESYRGLGAKVGPSPLTLDIPSIDEPGELYVGLAGPTTGAGLLAGWAGGSANPMDQPWRLAGEVTMK